MILTLFFCFVAGISSSLSFLSSSLLKFPNLQHPGTGFCFVAEIPSCNVSPPSDALARFWNHWYSSLVNTVIFLFVSAISSFPANLTFRLINGSLYPITDLPLNYRLSYLFLLLSLQFLQHVSIAEIACKNVRDTFRLVSGIFLSTNPLLR